MVMAGKHEQTERIEALWGLIERLSAPDLTLSEAKVLRGRLSDLLERDNRPPGPNPMATLPALVPARGRGDGARHEVGSFETSIPVAG
jgi:hypothetical protein